MSESNPGAEAPPASLISLATSPVSSYLPQSMDTGGARTVGTANGTPTCLLPTPETNSVSTASYAKRLHGFSVVEAAEATSDKSIYSSPSKSGRLVSLPARCGSDKLRAGGMRVVLPESGSENDVSTVPAAVAVDDVAAVSMPLLKVVQSDATAPSDFLSSEESSSTLVLQNAGTVGATPASTEQVTTPSSASPQQSAALGPLGKVVDPGQEHTGRWTKEEHESFLSALQMYGKEWKRVAARVKTRTVVQTRTHAQKYFQKLQKVIKTTGGSEGLDGDAMFGASVEMGTVLLASKRTPPGNIEKLKGEGSIQRKSGCMAVPSLVLSQQQQGPNAAAQAAAQLMAQMATSKPHLSSPPTSDGLQPPASVTFQHQKGQTHSQDFLPQQPLPVSGASTSSTEFADSCGSIVTTDHRLKANDAPCGIGTVQAPPPTHERRLGMTIVAPPPDHATRRGLFPEPSPAACGKRKLAEIAAAQMLAGVAAGEGAGGRAIPAAAPEASGTGVAVFISRKRQQPLGPTLVDGFSDFFSSRATPPPVDISGSGQRQLMATENKNVSALQSKPSHAYGKGFALQIVNPDTLEESSQNKGKRRRVLNGQFSPSTPWDGQLEALVSESKSKDTNENTQSISSDTMLLPLGIFEDKPGGSKVLLPFHPLKGCPSRSELHTAVCAGRIEAVTNILSCSGGIGGGSIGVGVSAVCQPDLAGFSPLHSAVSFSGILANDDGSVHVVPSEEDTMTNAKDIVHLLLSAGANPSCRDGKGNTPLHWAARAGNHKVAHMLIMKNCPLDAQNHAGETALHWAMRTGVRGLGAVRILLEDGARPSICDNEYRRPLDVAAKGFTETLGAPTSVKDGTTAWDKVEVSESAVNAISERRQTRANFFVHSPQSRTLVLHHPDCLDHIPKSSQDWEVPGRVKSILDRISYEMSPQKDMKGDVDTLGIRSQEVVITTEFDRAPLELLSRIHSAEYLSFVNDLSKELERRRKRQLVEANEESSGGEHVVVPFTPLVQRTMMKDSTIKKGQHSDTSFSAGSLRAARRAAGAVQHAVDCVLVGRNRNAFCIVRPPGHHAGVNGLLAGGESCGFCIFNNVAAGAMHALSNDSHQPRCQRCAIVDIDAHHGNGTEEIVVKCHDPGRLLFFSVHIFDHDRKKGKGSSEDSYKFYPGTGDSDDVAHNVINVPIAPLWREKEVKKLTSGAWNVSFPLESHHNTRQKKRQAAAAAAAAAAEIVAEVDSKNSSLDGESKVTCPVKDVSDTDTISLDDSSCRAGPSQTGIGQMSGRATAASGQQPTHYQMGLGRQAYRHAIQQRLLPALRAFDPDLILLSTGFDAARGDVGNSRHYAGGRERMGLDLEPEDYAWTTQKIMEVADICCQGRVVSVLEGGYGRTPTSKQQQKSAENSKAITENHHLDTTFFF